MVGPNHGDAQKSRVVWSRRELHKSLFIERESEREEELFYLFIYLYIPPACANSRTPCSTAGQPCFEYSSACVRRIRDALCGQAQPFAVRLVIMSRGRVSNRPSHARQAPLWGVVVVVGSQFDGLYVFLRTY